MSLNADQEAGVEWIVSSILESDTRYLTLVGAGGTGKTHCVMEAVQQLLNAGLSVVLTAPTNKAVKQLQKAAKAYGLPMDEVEFMTIHSALGLALLPNEDRKYAVRSGRGVMEDFDVVVIDEASMMPRRALTQELIPDCEQHDTKVLFMGDDLQLPPVKEPVSMVFTDEFPQFRLEKNMRQADGQLLTLNGMLRQAMLDDKPFPAPELDGEQVVHIPAAGFLSGILEAFDIDTNLEEQRVLAWTNRRVDNINSAIRHKIYGEGCAPFIAGEQVVTGGPLKNAEGEIILGTDEECIVHHVDEESYVTDEETGESYHTIMLVLHPIYADVKQVIAQVLREDEKERYHERLEFLARQAKNSKGHAKLWWKRFWSLKELFSDIRYCYCITVHRSQGSTYDRVFVDVKDILRNKLRSERQRLIYVGFSRPRHQLLINKGRYVA